MPSPGTRGEIIIKWRSCRAETKMSNHLSYASSSQAHFRTSHIVSEYNASEKSTHAVNRHI